MPETVVLGTCPTCKMRFPYLKGRCVGCSRLHAKQYHAANRERILARNKTPEFKAKKRAWQRIYDSRPEVIERNRERSKKRRALLRIWEQGKRNTPEYKEKIKARNALNRAIRIGRIERKNICEQCSSTFRVQAHHHNGYKKEHHLDVIWLCEKCHKITHRLP